MCGHLLCELRACTINRTCTYSSLPSPLPLPSPLLPSTPLYSPSPLPLYSPSLPSPPLPLPFPSYPSPPLLPSPLLHPSRVLPDKMAAVDAALSLARVIASKSPVAVYGTKHNLLYARDHSVEDGLEYVVSPEGSFHVTEHLVMDG